MPLEPLKHKKKVKIVPRPAKGLRLRAVRLGSGLLSVHDLSDELKHMTAVLLGREVSPVQRGVMSLMEVADAYFARACEISMLIHEAERDGTVIRNSAMYRFRTGELRDFLELSKRAADLGSRRLTDEQLRYEREISGRESVGD